MALEGKGSSFPGGIIEYVKRETCEHHYQAGYVFSQEMTLTEVHRGRVMAVRVHA